MGQRRGGPEERQMELVHRPQLLPQDVHGHGLVRVQGRGGFRRRAHEDFRHSGFNLKNIGFYYALLENVFRPL